MPKMKDNWTVTACLTELANAGWVYGGKQWNGTAYLYLWHNPTAGDPNNIPQYTFTLKEMRDECRRRWPSI